MAFTQADLDALDRAIADGRGARQMTFSDHSIMFNSIDDMLKLRAIMQHALNGDIRTFRVATVDKGV